MTIGIYCIKNTQNNKIYVGSSKNIEQRWSTHKRTLINNAHHSLHLQRAWNKYGKECFEFTILKVVDVDQLIELEQTYLDIHESYDLNKGYNISPTAGSCAGVKHDDSFKQKCSKRNKLRYLNPDERKKTGLLSKAAWTKEAKKIASERMRVRWADADIRQEMSIKTSEGASKPEIVEKRSKRMREFWKDSQKRQKASLLSPNKKRIQHIETGMIYESISEASRLLPISKQTIKNNLLGKFNSAKGMNFRYV